MRSSVSLTVAFAFAVACGAGSYAYLDARTPVASTPVQLRHHVDHAAATASVARGTAIRTP